MGPREVSGHCPVVVISLFVQMGKLETRAGDILAEGHTANVLSDSRSPCRPVLGSILPSSEGFLSLAHFLYFQHSQFGSKTSPSLEAFSKGEHCAWHIVGVCEDLLKQAWVHMQGWCGRGPGREVVGRELSPRMGTGLKLFLWLCLCQARLSEKSHFASKLIHGPGGPSAP